MNTIRLPRDFESDLNLIGQLTAEFADADLVIMTDANARQHPFGDHETTAVVENSPGFVSTVSKWKLIHFETRILRHYA